MVLQLVRSAEQPSSAPGNQAEAPDELALQLEQRTLNADESVLCAFTLEAVRSFLQADNAEQLFDAFRDLFWDFEVTAERLAAVPARSARHSLLVAIFEDIERLSGDAERLSDTSLSREEAALVALSRAHCAGLPFAAEMARLWVEQDIGRAGEVVHLRSNA